MEAGKLSKRAEKALAVLASGGYFRKALENGWHGGEKFVYRLYPAGAYPRKANAVPGFGFAAWNELEKAGKLAYKPCEKSSVWPSEWAVRA